MTLNDIYLISQVVAVAALIPSVLYLAVQVRQNTLQARANAAYQFLEATGSINSIPMGNIETARVIRRGLEDISVLDADERLQFIWFAGQHFTIHSTVYALWSEGRQDHIAYEQAHDRMVAEARENIAQMERLIDFISPPFDDFRKAVEDIRTCHEGEDVNERVNRAIQLLNITPAPRFQNNAISQLTTSERLLDFQSSERRMRYAQYARGLAANMEFSDTVSKKMEMRSDELHPFLDYGSVGNSSELENSGNKRSLVLTVKLSEACKDYNFRKMLYQWEGGTYYQINLIKRVLADTKTFLEELGESDPAEVAQ